MRLSIQDKERYKNIPALLREAGYRPELNRRTGQTSYIKSASGGAFPRFHVYVDETDLGWIINLHLDQKAPSYGGTSAHGGEYDGDVVEQEIGRLRGVMLR
jgi:hypothetical protein